MSAIKFHNIKRPPKVSAWRGLSRIEEYNHVGLIEWLAAYGGDLEIKLFKMGRKDLVDIVNQHGGKIPATLMGLKDWLAIGDRGARVELANFALENIGGWPNPEICKKRASCDAWVKKDCENGERCGKSNGRWESYVKRLWQISRDVAGGNVPSDDDWNFLKEMEKIFVTKPRRTFRTRTDEEAKFSQHLFYIDDPKDVIDDKQTSWWAKTQWLIKSTYRFKPHKTLWNKKRKPLDEIVSSCPEGGHLKMAKFADIVEEVTADDPQSSLRNLNDYELVGAEFEWKPCPERLPEKGEILRGGDATGAPSETGMDECFVWTGDKFYRIMDDSCFQKELEKRKYDRWAPPPQCLTLLREVYDEEFFDYVKQFRPSKSPQGSLLAGKPIEYEDGFRPEYSPQFCYFGRKPNFCSMSPCPIFSNEEYSFNKKHTTKFHAYWTKRNFPFFGRPRFHEWKATHLCTRVSNNLRLRRENDEVIRDMGFPILNAALKGLFEEIGTLTETGNNSCAYCGEIVPKGREHCPSTKKPKCYNDWYEDVKRPLLKPVV